MAIGKRVAHGSCFLDSDKLRSKLCNVEAYHPKEDLCFLCFPTSRNAAASYVQLCMNKLVEKRSKLGNVECNVE
jgi:hypothetical protein